MKLKPVGFVATPDDMDALQDYLSKFYGGEAVVAQTCAWMAWNLAAKLTADNDPAEDLGYYKLAPIEDVS